MGREYRSIFGAVVFVLLLNFSKLVMKTSCKPGRHFMRYCTFLILFFITSLSYGQRQNIVGIYGDLYPGVRVAFNADSTFEYVSKGEHPVFYRWEDFSEKGKWTVSGDTVILNPGLAKKIFVESDLKEQENPGDTALLLTFNHIKRWFDANGNIVKEDTIQIDRLDYCFNEWKMKKQTRVAPNRTTRCTFAGYIPKEVITTDRTISVKRPSEKLSSIFIGCYELQGTKEYMIKDPNASHLIFNVYSNYYLEGQLRRVKFLMKNEKILYTKQKKNGEFERDNIWTGTAAKLIRQKSGS